VDGEGGSTWFVLVMHALSNSTNVAVLDHNHHASTLCTCRVVDDLERQLKQMQVRWPSGGLQIVCQQAAVLKTEQVQVSHTPQGSLPNPH
jgi:hypothetical protein